MGILVWLASVLVTLISMIYLYFKFSFSYWKDRGVPYIEPIFPWGNIVQNGKIATLKAIIGKLYTIRETSIPFVGGYTFNKPFVLVSDLEFAKHVLIKDFNYFEDRGAYYNERDDPLSAHLFALDGSKWRVLRAKMTPTFTGGKMKFMFPTIRQVAEKLSVALESNLDNENYLEVRDLLARYFTDVIGTCIFGIECNSLSNPDAEFRRVGRHLFEKPHLPPILRAFTLIFPDLSRKLHIKVTSDFVSKFFMRILRETIEYRESHNVRRNDFMDILIQLKNGQDEGADGSGRIGKLTFEQIAAQAFVFFLGGFETSAATMSFALHELMVNNDIQDKVRKEIFDVLEEHNGETTYEALNDMKYLDHVITETLRKYPPVIFLIRKAVKDYPVPKTNKIIEKGMSIFIPVETFQHDPAIYPDPDVFDPDRFSSETEGIGRPSDAFLAFGDGPRNCIGLRFGLLQVKMGLVALLKHYRFIRCQKSQIPLQFTTFTPVLTPKGVWLGVQKI